MKLKHTQIAKIDPVLEEFLTHAQGDEVIRVIMVLEHENLDSKNASVSHLEPSQFPSPIAYRQALIEQRKRQLAEAVGDTIQELQSLSLKTLGGTVSRVITVEGTAKSIVRALELSGVNNVTLDQLVGLPELAPDEMVNHFAELYLKILDIDLDQKTRKLISQAARQYILNYQKRYNRLRILGMQQPVNLDDIYTEVQCLESDHLRSFEPIEALQKLYRQNGQRRLANEKSERINGIEIANQHQFLMILGEPGAGKSTFLRKIGLETLKGKSGQIKHELIPVLIELKQFADQEVDIFTTIQREFTDCQLPYAEKFTQKALQLGKLFILLDGLDEIPTKNIDFAVGRIRDFVQKFTQNKFIISCRTAAYKFQFNNGDNWDNWSKLIIADFNNQQIQQFLDNWFSSEVDKKLGTAEKCWNKIKAVAGTKELAQTPLLLTFICLEYDEYQDLPKNRATLYSNALDILLRKWAASKRLPGEKIYNQFGIDLEKIMLAEIAYTNFQSDKLFFSQQDILNKIQNFITSNYNAPRHLEPGKILDALTIEQGIIVERARDIFSFSHLTLQEYLTAQYIDDNRLVEKLVTEHLTDTTWKEVFLLVAGLMRGGADDLLLLMEKEAQKYINTPKLQALLKWAEDVTVDSEGNYKPVGKRAVAIAYANTYANAYININAEGYINVNAEAIAEAYINNTSALVHISVSAIATTIAIAEAYPGSEDFAYEWIAYTIEEAICYIHHVKKSEIFSHNFNLNVLIYELEALKAKIPDDKQSEAVDYSFAHNIIETLLNGFKLTYEMVDLSEEEIEALDDYLYANYLIIQWKEAAVKVSRETWEAIENRMLLPPDNKQQNG